MTSSEHHAAGRRETFWAKFFSAIDLNIIMQTNAESPRGVTTSSQSIHNKQQQLLSEYCGTFITEALVVLIVFEAIFFVISFLWIPALLPLLGCAFAVFCGSILFCIGNNLSEVFKVNAFNVIVAIGIGSLSIGTGCQHGAVSIWWALIPIFVTTKGGKPALIIGCCIPAVLRVVLYNINKNTPCVYPPKLALLVDEDTFRLSIGLISDLLILASFVRVSQVFNESVSHYTKELDMKTRVVEHVTHEIRGPLMSMSSILREYLRQSKPVEIAVLKTLAVACEDVHNISSEVLDYCKMQTNFMRLNYETFDLSEATAHMLDLFKLRTVCPEDEEASENVSINLHISKSLKNTRIIADRTKLLQCIRNLVSNAWKFTRKGSINVSCELRKLSDNLDMSVYSKEYFDQHFTRQNTSQVKERNIRKSTHQLLYVSVKDTGAGMNQENLSRVFHAFFQGEHTTGHIGTGLGLHITHDLVAEMNGKIWASSEGEGKGSTLAFYVVVKNLGYNFRKSPRSSGIRTVQKSPKISKRNKTSPNGIIKLRKAIIKRTNETIKLKVLFADDDPTTRFLFSNLLRTYDCEHHIAKDGDEAVELYKSGSYDVIFLDLNMPRVGGQTAEAMIRSSGVYNATKVPIILHTAADDEAEQIARIKGELSRNTVIISKEKLRSNTLDDPNSMRYILQQIMDNTYHFA